MSNNLIYVADEKFIKNIDTAMKLKYIPLINKFGIDTKIISNNTAFMYIIGYGFYAKFKTLNIIDKKNKLYSKLVNHYKLCDVSNMYFISYCDINYFDNIIKMKDYKKYCTQNNKKYITLPKDIDLMNIITYDISTLDTLLIITNDSSTSTIEGVKRKDENDNNTDIIQGDDVESDGEEESDDVESDGEEESDSTGNSASDSAGNSTSTSTSISDSDSDSDSDSASISDSDSGSGSTSEDIVPILWVPCNNQLKHNEYIKHIYSCKQCEFINNNNNLIYRNKKVMVITGKYDKIVDAYVSSTIYNRTKYKNNPMMLIAKINNPKSFYNECIFLI